MRGIEQIINDNSTNGIVMREAIKHCDWNTIDLLSCGSGYDVSEDELQYYLENKSFNGLLWSI